MVRQETSELWFTSLGQSKVEEDLVDGTVETEDEGLVKSEVDDLYEIVRMLKSPVYGLKYGIRVPVSGKTSRGSFYNNPEETFNNLMPEHFSANRTMHLIIIFHLKGSNNR
jgi:hypothetical protein